MSGALDESLRGLDGCGCCAGTGARVPETVDNRPGLPAVAYRVGTHASFRAHLLAALSAGGAPPAGAPAGWTPPLRALSARTDDFTVALLDAWAAVGDVLTFYQERIANESWLRTATERRSVLELAARYDVPLADEDLMIRTEYSRRFINGSYVKPITILPGYDRKWSFTLAVESYVLAPKR